MPTNKSANKANNISRKKDEKTLINQAVMQI
jgi:hypothetical protein